MQTVAALVVSCLLQAAAAVTYTQLAPLKGQWNLTILGTSGVVTSVRNCSSPYISAPCHEPLLNSHAEDIITVQVALKNATVKTLHDLEPTTVHVKLCYSDAFTKDRPWREHKDDSAKDLSCPIFLGAFDIRNAAILSTPKTLDYELGRHSNITKAVWYAQIYTYCHNGRGLVHCQYDTTEGVAFVATDAVGYQPSGLFISGIIFSVALPLLLVGYLASDSIMKKMA